jgi:hypothetical protein
MTLEELRARQRELQATMADIANDATRAEEFGRMEREFRSNEREINMMIQERQIAATTPAEQRNPDAILREVLIGARNGTHSRELTLATEVTNSGAVELNIHDLIDTVTPSTKLPKSLEIVHGVTGNDLYPVSINDLTMEEIGENVKAKDQKLDFDKITVTPHRATLNILISNAAIDNMAYPLMALVQNKFKKAEATYIAQKVLSQAAFTGNKGPFSSIEKAGEITLDGTAYKQILKAIADLINQGFDPESICLVMDAITEAELKATARAEGQGGFIIDNGLCAGYDYIASHFINTKDDGAGNLIDSGKKYIGIGCFNYLAVQQHGTIRLTIDSSSNELARQNLTGITVNTAYSFSDLSVKLNSNKTGKTMAFKLYEVVEA